MANRRKHSSDAELNQKDNPIGLTGAFDPISVDDSSTYDDPVGLTQAFGPVEDDEDAPNWDNSEKWDGFDWSVPMPEPEVDAAEFMNAPEPERRGRGRHARHAAAKTEEAAEAAADGQTAGAEPAPNSKSAFALRMESSRKIRKRLVVTIVLLLVIFAALGFAGYCLITNKIPFFDQPQAETQEEETSPNVPEIVAPSGQDTQEVTVQTVDIPELASLFGKTQEEALGLLQRGAMVTSSATIDDEDSAIKTTATVELTKEPGNPRSGGSPKVYLGLNEDGKIVQVGYSAPAGSLGYETLNFQDAVSKEHIIERTLKAIGANVQEGTVALPADPKEYTTYGSDGTTVVKERQSFDGDVEAGGVPCSWSAVLSYDYTSANISGNSAETVRLIYVYLTEK